MEVKVLGTGCAKCDKLYQVVQEAVAGAGVEAEVTKVDKLDQIMAHGVMLTPALIIDGQMVAAGKVPKREQIVTWLIDAAAKAE